MSTGFLMSFHYYRKTDMAALASDLHGFRLFADSGAFSAKSVGADVTLDDYCDWLKKWRGLFTTYVTLDKIGQGEVSAEGTWRNHVEMEARGLRPTPVFHGGEPFEYLERYIERGHGYIALGGMVGAPAVVKKWIIKCFKLAEGRAVFHGFGRTNLADIADFPWYSVDSSSWGSGYRYGQVVLFDRGRWVRVKIGDHKGVYQHAALIRQHGVDPKFLADRSLYHWRYAAAASAVAWHRLGQWAHKRHAPVHIPTQREAANQPSPGPHLYLADAGSGSNNSRVKLAAESIREQGQEAEPVPHMYLADTATGVNLRLPVAAEAIRDEQEKDPGPHLYLATDRPNKDSLRAAGAAAEALREQGEGEPGPHMYLASTANGSNPMIPAAAEAIRTEQGDPGPHLYLAVAHGGSDPRPPAEAIRALDKDKKR